MARSCVSSYTQIGRMKNQRVFRFLLLYNILETVYRVAHATDGRTQAFLQTEGELSHFVDDGRFQFPEYLKAEDASAVSFTNLDEENLNTYASPVSFQPPMLDFNSHPVGMPHMERVVVKNLSPDTSIHMLSISGNTLHFHCSFFQEKVIPPGGNTSFDVVFLARHEGPVENTLFIHTSLGSFKYQVVAVGTPNPYRLKPLIGVKMPLNSSYTPLVHMHNPHSSTIQLTEMYTSGGDLHLELPDGEGEAPKNIWEIPPYETKPVIKANFIARVEKNHTAFIRIRTNETHPDYLILPVEVDVTSTPGIYSPTEILDFGILRSHDPPKVLSLSLLNSGQKHIHIVNVIVTPVNEAVDVKFIPIKIPPDTVFSTQVATISFNPAKALHPKQCSGKIVVKSKNNQFKLHVPYQVYLLKGSLDYNKSTTRFYVGPDLKNSKIDVRELNITNSFNVTIIIYNLSLPEEAEPHFKVSLKEPVVLKPGETLPVVWLTFQPAYKNLQLTTYLRLHTNISYFDVPLLCFSGRLKVFLPHAMNESVIDFGTLGMGDKRTMIFAVINENPVDVNLKLWGSNISKTYVELVGVHKGNASTLAWRHNFSAMAHSLILKPHHYAIFRIGITAPSYEGVLSGHAFVETQYEKINIPFNLRTAKGGLKVDEIYFGNTFPGKISTLNFYVHSTFSHSMTVTGVSAIPEDPRFTFDPLKHASPILYPNSRNMVGKVHFDLRKQCKQKCYSGLPTTTSKCNKERMHFSQRGAVDAGLGHQWLLGMSLPPDVADMDKELFRTLHSRWKKLVETEGRSINLTLGLDTTEVRGHLLKAAAMLQWPRLFGKHSVKFPITQIGNHSVKDFTLENPSSLPLIVQVVPLSLYPKPQEVTHLLTDCLGGKLANLKHISNEPDIFTLEDLEENNKSPENHIPTYRKSVEEYFGVQSHKQSIAILLTPGMRVRIHVGFTPKDELFRSSLLLIRNNLTVLDAFLLQGQGGHGEIKFGNISPGSEAALSFELTDKHLKDCDCAKTAAKFSTPNFTVRKPFTARNTGALPIYVRGFDINGKPCEAYGFRILNCEGFELKPNESKRVDIAFTPDFTLTRVERSLNIHTSQGPNGQILQFKLVATVPRHMLAHCANTLPRPYWELFVYYTFNIMTAILIVGLLVFAHVDSQKILRSSYFPVATIGIHSEKLEKVNMFDLKSISCPANDTNSTVKVVNCRPNDVKKQKDGSLQKATTAENSSSQTVTPSSSSSSSHKRNSSSFTKNKDTTQNKDCDENANENTVRHSKRKASKFKLPQENYVLEPEFVEIKKSQPRNSWTRFLKPPFSFSSYTALNKPSVATQTSSDESESVAKGVETAAEQEAENESMTNVENSIKNRGKGKKETKYVDSKEQSKKNADSTQEEETSSTTTESSTTESDISEKDHHLPDICVTAKVPKSRFTKKNSREKREPQETESVVKPVSSPPPSESDDFELSSKSRGHKKIKVDPNKVFGGDILRPSTLELPYKPKPVIGDKKKDECFSSEDPHVQFKGLSRSSLKQKAVSCYLRRNNDSQYRKAPKFSIDKFSKNHSASDRGFGKGSSSSICNCPVPSSHDSSLNEFSHQTDGFSFRPTFRHNLWPVNSLENPSFSGKQGHYAEAPTSYSAVLSRDISSKKSDRTASGNNPDCVNNFKSSMGNHHSSLRATSACNYLGHCGSSVNNFGNSSIPSQFSCSRASDDLSASKLKHWIMHSDCLSSSSDVFCSLKDDDVFCKKGQVNSSLCYPLCSNSDSIWSNQPLSIEQAIQAERLHRLEAYRKKALYGDWPGFDLSSAESTNRSDSDFWGEKQAGSDLLTKSDDISGIPWDTPAGASSWKSVSKVWSSPSCDNSVSPVGNSTVTPKAPSTTAEGTSQGHDSHGEFNPFHTLSNLWISHSSPVGGVPSNEPISPSDSGNDNNNWSFSLFSEPASPAVSDSSQVQEKKEDDEEPDHDASN